MLHVSRREQIFSSVIFSFILICRLHFSLLVVLDSAPKDRLHFNQSFAFFLRLYLRSFFADSVFCGKFLFFAYNTADETYCVENSGIVSK